VLERYIVDAFLGEGGMGQVYRGHHLSLGFPVAIKVLTDLGPEMQGRFQREARLMARVRHANVVTVLDIGLIGADTPCIAMEFVEGDTLEARLGKRGVIPWNEAARITMGVLAGLDAIHAAAILHRDLKPGNVLLACGPPESVKLIDFGIARPEGTDVTRYTSTGMLVGTPGYMAPERLMNRPVDGRSDLYAVGLMFYEMLVGVLPFGGKSIESVLRRAVVPIPAPVIPAAQPVPPSALIRLVMASVDMEPAGRPATAKEFANQLAQAVRETNNLSSGVTGAVRHPTASRAVPVPQSVIEAADTVVDAPGPGPEGGFVVLGARLPPSRLAAAEDRRWLGEVAGVTARAFSLGGTYWFTVIPIAGDPARARQKVSAILASLAERYGQFVKVEWGIARGDFDMSAASLSGASPLPTEIRTLLDRLSAA
jgi:serine/threonine protein kinase